jgi:hypothetical protein
VIVLKLLPLRVLCYKIFRGKKHKKYNNESKSNYRTRRRWRQLSHYINNVKKPGEKTVRKIEKRIHVFANEISSVSFV